MPLDVVAEAKMLERAAGAELDKAREPVAVAVECMPEDVAVFS